MEKLLEKYGFSSFGKYEDLEDGFYARITSQSKGMYEAVTNSSEVFCEVNGKIRFKAQERTDFPAVGDYVVLDRDSNENGNAIIREILPRKSTLVRNASGAVNEEQIIASNIDYIFICTSLNNDFNLKRLERYITLAWNSGATPVVVLTKADLCEDVESKLIATESVALGAQVLLTSSVDEDGLEEIEGFIKPGNTIAMIGSSGVGKSTIINRLLGAEYAETSGIRNDDKGRHTTTRRQMYLLPLGGILIDTPGMKEVGLVSDTEDFSESFSDVEDLFLECRFSDCTHTSEPGCAVFKAISEGRLSEKRWNSYNRLRGENEYAQDKEGYLKKKDKMLEERKEKKRESMRRKMKR